MDQITHYIDVAAQVVKLIASIIVIWQTFRKKGARKRP